MSKRYGKINPTSLSNDNKLGIITGLENYRNVVLFRYLKFSSYSLKNLCKELDAKGYSDFLEDFQEFLYDFTSRDFSDARKSYASHIKSCGLSYNDNVTIRNIINKLPDDKIKKYVTDDNSKIVHYHLRRGGKGKVVLFGVEIGMALYLIAVDAKHKILP